MLTYIDNELLKKIIIGAKQNLDLNKAYVDSLNVFPVPDGDTGTNMSLTMTATVREVEQENTDNIADTIHAFSKGALKGARGNSGVILSQIFKGMAEVISQAKIINTKTFAKALSNGSDKAYDAVTHPKEGTILTVIRVIGDYANKIALRNTDFVEFFEKILQKGEEILLQTPEMLPVLKKAGVIDAGGQGLLYILIGMYNIIAGKEMTAVEEETETIKETPKQVYFEADIHNLDDIRYGYCTEFFVINLKKSATTADIDKLRDKLSELGDSVIVVGDLQLVKVHVHTNNPDKALSYALNLGELDKPKIENMFEQNRQLKKEKEKQVKKAQGMVSISSGKGFKELFTELGVDAVLEGGQTMNPSVSDIVDIVNSVPADTVFIFPNNKNIILACEQARELTKNKLVVVATNNIPMGVAAAMTFDSESDVDENLKIMQKAACSIKCLQITHAVRDTELDGFELHNGDIIGLKKHILAQGKDINQVAKDTIEKVIDDDIVTITLYYGEDMDEEKANELRDSLSHTYPDRDIIAVYGGQPHYYYLISLE
ncbi:MAG: DAK2 domain-containing protein [Bacillota bacterium]|jgi:DAK2 domain fusion protein YloV|nr:DAK2 domain-containing protein [Bacillota bacterium]HHU43614.1 DAK2 domain-containing protein [Clostridiales bacterium]